MPGQRSKGKKHFTASTENELRAAVISYAEKHHLDKNTALRKLLWESAEREGLVAIPDEFKEEVKETQRKFSEQQKSAGGKPTRKRK